MMTGRKNDQKRVGVPSQQTVKPSTAGPRSAPPVYRPQPVPKVLQLKSRTTGPARVNNPAQSRTPQLRPRDLQMPSPQPKPQPSKAPGNRPPVMPGPHSSRNLPPRTTSHVVQRAEGPIMNVHNEVILMIMNVVGMRIGALNRPDALNFAMTCSRIYNLGMDPQYSDLGHARHMFHTSHRIPAILAAYGNTLEPLRHGAHLDVERLGLPGSGTILGLAINGRLIPWKAIPEDFETRDGFNRAGWEGHVKSKVDTYSQLSIEARPEREEIRALTISAKQKRALTANSPGVVKARENSPAKTFQVFLLMNKTLKHHTPFKGLVADWLEKRQSTLYQLLFGSEITEYFELGLTQKEPDSCGHSEQLMLMSKQWEDIRIEFFTIANLKLQGSKEWIQPRQVVLMLNRSPCSSCGRFFVAELEAFWQALAEMSGLSADQCRIKFQNVFIFRLAYTVRYGKTGIPKDRYPNFTILQALTKSGWVLEKLPKLAPKDRHPEACLTSETVSQLKRNAVNLKKIAFKQEESDDDYEYSGSEEDDDYGSSESSDEDRKKPPRKRQKKGK
jgi:hypothetical protein